MRHLLITFILISGISFTSCKKEEMHTMEEHEHNGHEHNNEIATVTFSISTLNENDVILANETVQINGTAEGTASLHGYKVEIFNLTTNNNVVFTTEDHTHSMLYSLDHNWINSVSETSNMEAKITVYLNHEHTMSSEKSILFSCQN